MHGETIRGSKVGSGLPHAWFFAVVLTFLFAIGCGGNVLPAPGQLMVVLSTDMTPGKDFDEVVLSVSDPRVQGTPSTTMRFRYTNGVVSGDQLPATVAIIGITGGIPTATLTNPLR